MSSTGKKVAATLAATAAAIALLFGVFSPFTGSNAQMTPEMVACITKLKDTNVRQGLGLTDDQITAKCAAVPTSTTVAQTTSTSPATGATTTMAPTTTVAASTSTTQVAMSTSTAPTAAPVAWPSTGTMPQLPLDASHGSWKISENSDINKDPIVRDWLTRLRNPAPTLWPTFPNVPNSKVKDFPVKNGNQVPWGAEYGVANVPFCQQDQRCDFVVPARHYRLITADYSFQGMECRNTNANNRRGCLLLLINVGGETQIWRDQVADNGFTVPGRYWDGDHLEWAAWGLVSHASANMLNLPTNGLGDQVLNAGGNSTNAGANCGVPNACPSVEATIVVSAGDRILAVAKSTITPQSV